MKVRRVKLLLWAASGALAGAGALTLLLGFYLPYDAPTQASSITPAGHHIALRPQWTPAINDFGSLADVDLRRPLSDQPVAGGATATPAVEAPSSLQLKLVGTAVERGHCYGFFATPDGQTKVKGVGDQFDGAEVLDVQDGVATIRYNGAAVRLQVPKPQ